MAFFRSNFEMFTSNLPDQNSNGMTPPWEINSFTPTKINSSFGPEEWWLEDEIFLFEMVTFQGTFVNCQGCKYNQSIHVEISHKAKQNSGSPAFHMAGEGEPHEVFARNHTENKDFDRCVFCWWSCGRRFQHVQNKHWKQQKFLKI